jgi:hypothetical protein
MKQAEFVPNYGKWSEQEPEKERRATRKTALNNKQRNFGIQGLVILKRARDFSKTTLRSSNTAMIKFCKT